MVIFFYPKDKDKFHGRENQQGLFLHGKSVKKRLAFYAVLRYDKQENVQAWGGALVEESLISRMEQQFSAFSKGQRRIAAYIRDHYETAAYMTALRLGEETGVSESTVVRFAAQLGFDGYPALQKAVQELTRSRLTSVQRVEVAQEQIPQEQVAQTILSCDRQNLQQTLTELSPETFTQAVDLLCNARRVYVFGAGSCQALSLFFTYYLNFLIPDVRRVTAAGEAEVLEQLLHIDENDLIVGISFPRYSSRSGKAMQFAHRRGAKVLAITDSPLSPVAQNADCCLTAHSDLATVVDSLVAPMSLINALLVAISLRRADANRPVLSELEELWQKHNVYQSLQEDAHDPE